MSTPAENNETKPRNEVPEGKTATPTATENTAEAVAEATNDTKGLPPLVFSFPVLNFFFRTVADGTTVTAETKVVDQDASKPGENKPATPGNKKGAPTKSAAEGRII